MSHPAHPFDEDRIARELRAAAPIVPAGAISGRALVVIIAIMTFLASLTIAAVDLVRGAAQDWQASVVREVTIQVRPRDGRDLDKDLAQVLSLARATKGVAAATAYSREETVRMLEPWLGTGLGFSDLPIPRLIVVRLDETASTDLAAFGRAVTAEVPSASLDDHRQWFDRLRAMAQTVIVIGLLIVALMAVTTALSVVFATRAAMATNAQVVEVLHFVGAPDKFIAREFEYHFLWLGLRGGVIGGAGAFAVILVAQWIASLTRASAVGSQIEALFGTFSLGLAGIIAIGAFVLLIAAMTAWTSRFTVFHTLRELE